MFEKRQEVWVIKKVSEKNRRYPTIEKRKGFILETYEKFVCIWLEARLSPGKGWRECFLYADIGNTVKIEPTEGFKQASGGAAESICG